MRIDLRSSYDVDVETRHRLRLLRYFRTSIVKWKRNIMSWMKVREKRSCHY